jgi:SAM-dependent methyltransferase
MADIRWQRGEGGRLVETAIKRLNWGCGSWIVPGWINADQKDDPRQEISGDIRDGLPLDDGSIDYAVAIHALPEVPYPDLVPVLQELRRVLKPGGTLRVSVPDLNRSIAAYQRGDRDYFQIPDGDAASTGGKFCLFLNWYGYTRSLFTPDYIEELLLKAGYATVHHCGYKETRSAHPGIVELDNREDESLFVEGVK